MLQLCRLEFAGSDVAFSPQFVEMSAWVHPFVQHADDLDHAVPGKAIVKDVDGPSNLRSHRSTTCVSDMEAAKT
jgi:hypothetical protein